MTKKKKSTTSDWNKRRHVRDYIDADYLDKLSPEERAWYDKFTSEYYHQKFANDGTDLIRGREPRRVLSSQNNARARDAFNMHDRIDTDTESTPADDEDAE